MATPDYDLNNWTAKRSGARITVTGETPGGEEKKIAVDVIGGGKGGPAIIALNNKTGEQWRLAP